MRAVLRWTAVVLTVLLAACSQATDIAEVGAEAERLSEPIGDVLSTDVDDDVTDTADTPTLDDASLDADAAIEDLAVDAEAAVPLDEAPAAATLRAGSVDDNDRFVDYLDYRERFLATGVRVHDRDVSERHVVTVTDADGRPVLGARVSLHAGDQELQVFRTRPDGRALLHPLVTARPDAATYTITAEHAGATASTSIDDRGTREHALTLGVRRPEGRARLDVHLLIDATGSMGDEIDRLKATMAQVAARITALPARPDVRWGMTAYRDRGDTFVTRTVDLTPDLAAFTAELATLEADEGGDEPEALNEALHAAIGEPAWDTGDAVRIVFLIADAPPHLDYPDDRDYAVEMFVAAERGIAIVPLASSGLSDQGEYIYRQLAQTTLGRFFFLTYGADGQPGDDTPHDVDGYEVAALDELIVRYVAEQLAHVEARAAQQ